MTRQNREMEITQKIDAYLKGKLSAKEIDQLWAEFLKHPEYFEMMKTEAAARSLYSKAAHNESSQEEENEGATVYTLHNNTETTSGSGAWKWISVAASVAALFLVLNIFDWGITSSANQLAVAEISVSVMETPDVVRSSSGDRKEIDSLLSLGFEAAISGRMGEAERIYDTITQRYEASPSVSMAHLNLGIIRYNQGNYEKAVTSFQKAVQMSKNNRIIEEKSQWYLGNAYLNLKKYEKAREAVHATYALEGVYRSPAFQLLKKLDHQLGNVDFDEPPVSKK